MIIKQNWDNRFRLWRRTDGHNGRQTGDQHLKMNKLAFNRGIDGKFLVRKSKVPHSVLKPLDRKWKRLSFCPFVDFVWDSGILLVANCKLQGSKLNLHVLFVNAICVVVEERDFIHQDHQLVGTEITGAVCDRKLNSWQDLTNRQSYRWAPTSTRSLVSLEWKIVYWIEAEDIWSVAYSLLAAAFASHLRRPISDGQSKCESQIQIHPRLVSPCLLGPRSRKPHVLSLRFINKGSKKAYDKKEKIMEKSHFQSAKC